MVRQGEREMMILLPRKLLLRQRPPMYMAGMDEGVLVRDYLGFGAPFVYFMYRVWNAYYYYSLRRILTIRKYFESSYVSPPRSEYPTLTTVPKNPDKSENFRFADTNQREIHVQNI